MTVSLRNREEDRSWTFREWVQGQPLGHPSHPLFVHFPVAFYLAVIVLDIMSRITPSPGLVLVGTYLLVGALLATIAAASTGLVDWAGMVRGSSKKGLATRHMLAQLTGAAFFIVTLVIRWGDRGVAEAETLWIVLEIIGYLFVISGQYLGGVLVYEKGMRVRTGAGPG